jgi:hypothetical protein
MQKYNLRFLILDFSKSNNCHSGYLKNPNPNNHRFSVVDKVGMKEHPVPGI